MLHRFALIASLASAALVSSAEAGFWRYSYTNAASAWNSTITAEFDPGTNRFKWDFTSGTAVNGFWVALSPGPNPKGHAGELAIMFVDAKALTGNTSVTPKLTIYSYNGVNGITSYIDGNPSVAGNQPPDRIFSSMNPDTTGTIMQLTATDNGTSRRFTVELNAGIVQNHAPLYPNPSGNDWTGLAFGAQLGTWFHPTAGTATAYGTDPTNANFNYLTSYSYTSQSAFDTTNLTTQWIVPTPGAVALLGFAGLVGARRRR